MHTERFDLRHKTGIVRLTGGNRGLLYTNERQVTVEEPAEDGGEPLSRTVWEYDVYDVDDARQPGKAKCEAIETEHPFGDETKILRKTLAKVLRKLGEYDGSDYDEFRSYDQFCEAITAQQISGSVVAPEPTEEELLDSAKAAKIAEIERYNSSANVNAFTVDGNPMWLDFDLRSRLKNSIDAAEADGRQDLTKKYGGLTFTYSVEMWRMMFTIVENYAGDCLNITEQHKSEVMALATVEQVEAYDVTLGYPKNPSF